MVDEGAYDQIVACGAGVSHFMPEETPQFIGEFEDVPVDPKGRLILPAAFRKVLPLGVNSFVIARWFDGCLAGFEPTRWKQILRQLLELGGGQRQSRQLGRTLAARAVEVKIDGQGRVLVPRKHLDMAGIGERATVIGAVDRVEIWNTERYGTYMQEADEKLEEIAEQFNLL